MKKILFSGLTLLLSACGGGGSDNDKPRHSFASSVRSAVSSNIQTISSRNSSISNGQIIVTPIMNGHGQIQPSGPQVVAAGSQLSFTITPDNGFYIASVSGCAGNLQNQIYTTANLVNDCEVTIQFNQTGFVFIPDPLLKNAIRNELNLSNTAEISSSQMRNLQQLEMNSVPETLIGLETATNLEYLWIQNQMSNPIALDISPIASLTDINDLSLININIVNASSIQNLTNLININFSESIVDNVEALNNLSKIRNINIAYSNIEDINFLSGKNSLNYVNITGTPVYDLTPLLTSGLGSGDVLSINYTCVYTEKYSNNIGVIDQLRARNVSIFNNFQNTGLYAEEKICSNHLTELGASVNAIYSATGLDINWQFANNNQELVCEIFADLQGQQPRIPLAVVEDCGSTSSTSFNTVFSNAPLFLQVWDRFGSAKLFTASVTNVSHSTAYLHSYEWGQTIVKNNSKLIPNKPALLRLHILAEQAIPAPDIQIRASLDDTSVELVPTKPAQLPTNKSFNNLNQSYRVAIDSTLMHSGLSIRVTVAGVDKIITPNFGAENKLNITLVPIQIESTLGIIPSHSSIKSAFLKIWPFSEINLRNRSVYVSSAETSEDMENVLHEIQELQIIDNDNSHYYGFFSNDIYDVLNFNGFGGLAFIGDTAGIGSDYDPGYSIILHELGHNFGLAHVNCGGPVNYDPLYPYSTNSIGSLGINNTLNELMQPNSYRDMMSYCKPEFVSDYSYEKAQDYIERNPSEGFETASRTRSIAASPAQKNLFISGVISAQSVSLRRIIPLSNVTTNNQEGQYTLRIYDSRQIQKDYHFDTKKIDHNQKASDFFSLIIPYDDIASLEIWRGKKLLFKEEQETDLSSNSWMQYQKTTQLPVVTQNNNICLAWDNNRYDSATLILHHTRGQSAIFMDTRTSPYCVDYPNVTDGTQWQIIMRKGLKIDESWQEY